MHRGTGLALTLAVLLLDLPASPQIQNQPDDGQWIMAAKNYASTRYSSLTEIITTNVGILKVAFDFSTGTIRGN